MKKTEMMKAAHKIAKEIVWKTKNYSIALSFAMKYVWKASKRGKKRMGNMALMFAIDFLTTSKVERESIAHIDNLGYIPSWIAEKNLQNEEYFVVKNYLNDAYIERATEKAVDICFSTKMGKIWMWCPKSVISK